MIAADGRIEKRILRRLEDKPPYPWAFERELEGRARCPQRAGGKGKMKFHGGGLGTNRSTLASESHVALGRVVPNALI